jgi:3-oxocholest-4-en-26-oate---CoA ligase
MTQLSENWATLWEALAAAQPDHVAVVVGDRQLRWRDLEQRAARLAGAFGAYGVGADSKVAQLLYNCPEYIESVFAAFKVRATPVNVNYRYLADEVAYILANSDAEVLVFHGSLADRLADVSDRAPHLRLLLQVDDGAPLLDGALWYHEVLESADAAAPIERSGDDLLFLYTGGTTGLPKGVMWRHVDLFGALAFTGYVSAGLEVPTTSEQVGAVAAALNTEGRSPVNLCAPPLMHGTALFLAISAFVMGGTVVLLGGRRFDADELWRLVEQHRVTQLSIVGDAFARPMVAALEAAATAGTPFRIESLQRIVSTGATLSAEHKRAFQHHAPQVVIIDMIGASEGGPFAISMTMPGQAPADTAVFTAPPNAVVIDDSTGMPAERGSGVVGMLAVSGPMPTGYYGDEAKTATTFRTIDGVRYTVPGDYATIDTDGTVHLLGRGSVCINTGGEKVYPEEVEVAARSHPAVLDCTVVGVADARFGEAVTLVASLHPGAAADDRDVIDHVRGRLAAYKAPKRVVWVDTIERSPSGKADYRWARSVAEQAVPSPS